MATAISLCGKKYVSVSKMLTNFICVFVFVLKVCLYVEATNGSIPFNYLTHKEMGDFLQNLQIKYPKLASVYSIGKSVKGKQLWVLRITVDEDSRFLGKPMLKYVANMHGDETVGRQMLLYLSAYLLENYGKDDRVTRIVNSTEIHFLPTLNPDGFETAREGSCDGVIKPNGRDNAHDVDLNRNFPDQFDVPPTSPSGKEPETLAAMTWIVSNPFVLSANLHGGAVVASYPFDDSPGHKVSGEVSPSPDNALFQHLAQTYADSHLTMHKGVDCAGEVFPNGVTNGAHWYDVPGGMQDFNYIYSNCFEITLELSCCKYPNASHLQEEWDNNREALLTFMEKVHMGIKGLVLDAVTKQGIERAFIKIGGIDHNVTTTERGEFWRLLLPGNYTLYAEAFGYKSPVKREITVLEGKMPSWIEIVLEPNSTIPQETEPKFSTEAVFEHHSWYEMVTFLNRYAHLYSHITRLYEIGQSVLGKPLYVLEISDNPGRHEPGEPEFKYVANIHGDEVVGREMLLLLIQLLCENYGHNQHLTHLVNSTRIHILPSMNPDGYDIASRTQRPSTKARGNAHKVDLNRNFPDQFGVTAENIVQEPETKAAMAWIQSYPFILSASLHGGGLVANYPFDNNAANKSGQYSACPDDAIFRKLSHIYADEHPTMHLNRPCRKDEAFPEGIINGAMWYSVSGGMQDWNYLHSNCFELTIELGCDKFPPSKDLKRYWSENWRPLLAFMQQVHTGIKGFVFDVNHNPLHNAIISVKGIDHNVTTSTFGDYWRLVVPGTYTVSASFHGYQSQTKQVTVKDGVAAEVNFSLASQYRTWSAEQDYSLSDNMAESYADSEHLQSMLRSLNDDKLITIMANYGKSGDMKLQFAVINSSEGSTDKTKVILIGGLHGNQPVGQEVLLRLVRHITTGYSKGDSRLHRILSNIVLHVVPSLDSRGFSQATMGTCEPTDDPSTDLGNRFGSNFKGNTGPVDALIVNFEKYQYDVGLSLEGHGLGIRLPSTVRSKSQSTEAKAMKSLGEVLQKHYIPLVTQDVCHFQSSLGYFSLLDHLYQTYDTKMMAFHTSCCSYPNGSMLPHLWMESLEPLLQFLESASQGVRGHVIDVDGRPVVGVMVSVSGMSRKMPVDNRTGLFHLNLAPGTYMIQVTGKKYEMKAEVVEVTNRNITEISIVLDPKASEMHYHSYDEMQKMLERLNTLHPNITHLFSLGKSLEKKDLWVLEISPEENQPRVLLTAGLHGNELVGSEVLLHFAEFLLLHYNRDTTLTRLMRNNNIQIAPLLNPDGAKSAKRGTCKHSEGLGNSAGYDLDASFFAPEGINDKIPEVVAVKKWMSEMSFVLSVALSAGDVAVQRPFQDKSDNVTELDATIFRELVREYSSLHPTLHWGNKTCKDVEAVSWGRTYLDYIYGVNHRLQLGVKLHCCSSPRQDELSTVWQQHKASLLQLLILSNRGVKGFVSRSDGMPIEKAKVFVNGSNIQTLSNSAGYFWYLLVPGPYSFTVSAAGFTEVTKVVNVFDGTLTSVIFELEEDSRILGVPRHIFVLLLGSCILVVLVVALCTYSTVLRNQSKSKGFLRIDGSSGPGSLFEDDDDDLSKDKQKQHLLKTLEYHDSSSSSEDEMYNTYRWRNGKTKKSSNHSETI